MMNLRAEAKTKPHSASFSSLHTNESFHHFRSVSYFEAVANASVSGSRKSCDWSDRPRASRFPSSSTPCTPKKIEIEKYSTLPVSVSNGVNFPSKKTRSSSLSSFFRKFRPKFHRGSANPWIVIEFANGHNDDDSSDSDKSDKSIEQAVQSKVQHFTSLKDLYAGDVCNCALRKDSTVNSLADSKTSVDCSSSRHSNVCNCASSKKDDVCNCPESKQCNCSLRKDKHSENFNKSNSRYRSENSLFFRLSPRRRIENLKHLLKGLSSKRKRFRTSSSMHSLGARSCTESCLRTDYKITSGAFSSFSQNEYGRASSPVFHFCRPHKQDNLLSLRHSVDCSYLLKLPNSRSSNASLSSVLEDSSLPRRAQPPNTLSLSSGLSRNCRKMASVESIGACSLDFEASCAEFGAKDDLTASECTLHSGGVATSVQEERNPLDKPKLTNGLKTQCAVAELKLPSYVSISCAINGYPGYSRFCRSRDNSPARASIRKTSLEPSMLAETAETAHRYSRSQSDSMTVYTESRRVTVSKQIQVPLKSSLKYTTEVTFSNGHSLDNSDSLLTNGHLALAKEVGGVTTKSLVRQRIESLYGKEEVQVVRKCKEVNGESAEKCTTPNGVNGKNHIGSVSPPVFRHLNKDFRKQLQINIPKKTDSHRGGALHKDLISKKENGFSNGHDECDRVKSLTPPPLKSKSIIASKPSPSGDGEGYRFLQLIDLEREKIREAVTALEEELATASIPEEASGKIRAACGKANLLITQKFEQFRGLCWKHIEESPSVPFYTTASDLAGFWDLVMLQVEDISATFREIEAMRRNDWKEVVCEKPPTPVSKIRHSNPNAVSRSNPTTPKRSAKSAELIKAREEARRQLLAAKKKGRQQTNPQDEIAIFTPASNNES